MTDERDIIAKWMAREILPHERAVRSWLTRRWGGILDADDIIQDAYCRIVGLRAIEHIKNGRAYFFTTAHSIVMDNFRHAKTANAKSMTEIDWIAVEDESPLADRTVAAKQELVHVDTLLSKLSQTCRRVVELRRLQGLSQRETADHLGISEHSVENHIKRGIRSVMNMLAQQEAGDWEQGAEPVDKG